MICMLIYTCMYNADKENEFEIPFVKLDKYIHIMSEVKYKIRNEIL